MYHLDFNRLYFKNNIYKRVELLKKLSVRDFNLAGKKLIMRVDFNVPLDRDLNVADSSRIKATLSTVQYILKEGGSLILISHLGRPRGEVDPDLSLAPCARVLSSFLNQPVKIAPDCIGEKTKEMVKALREKEVMLLENVRFYRAEEHPEEDLEFAKILASYGDYYANDAFGCCHRKHSSITELPKFFPEKSACGFLLEKEIQHLEALKNPTRPFYAVIGGAKVSSKIGVLSSLLQKVDKLFLGGGMAYLFLKAQGKKIGKSLCENDLLSLAKSILEESSSKKIPILLPIDVLCAEELSENCEPKHFDMDQGIPDNYQGLDIGPKTVDFFIKQFEDGKTLLWNGPLGVYEFDKFAQGTRKIAEALKTLHATTIVGGGDSIAALQATGNLKGITHISTGGGATLEYIEHGTLPGIEALSSSKIISN